MDSTYFVLGSRVSGFRLFQGFGSRVYSGALGSFTAHVTHPQPLNPKPLNPPVLLADDLLRYRK